ncbi:protein WVD2-like 5 isoform X2 [Glycine soja]|uniref:TPX2 C-terminal domain-containing protein n=1 Tax=Glycine max TaxID=3847 RepID=A0A0R0K4Y9_SOYBN|nr:protein WVD2-like 5 isoform X2 [Glycine soja]
MILMMDPSNLLPADGLEEVHQNGVHDELSNSGKDDIASNVDPGVTKIIETAATNGNFENFIQYDSTATDYSSKEGSNDNIDVNNVTISKEEEAKIIDRTGQLKVGKGPAKNKNAKPPSPRGSHVSSVKKNKDGKDEEVASAVSNGTFALDSHPRQPIKNRSLSDKQARLSKHPGKSNAATSEESMEKSRPRLLKKEPLDNLQGETESSSPTAEDAKPRRVGALPKYGFSFKCDERAERRKEFYTKLEEKIHAKEVEESNLQAKTKETQEAEIKMLRKSLGFKATPMPSFYQEPPPPRVELKKMPTTRAKSPKLGRKKSSTNSEPEGNLSNNARQGRLSLDEKVSQTNPTKGISPVHQKKPQRKSLPPQLTSEKTRSSNSASVRTSSKAVNGGKNSLSSVTTEVTTLSNPREEEKVEIAAATEENNVLLNETSKALPLNIEPDETESPVNGDLVIQEKPQLNMAQEPIAAEH